MDCKPGSKHETRLAPARARPPRAELQASIVATDIGTPVTQLYVGAVAAERRLATAGNEARIGETLRTAPAPGQSGRASLLEDQRAGHGRTNA